ncbi:MAG: ribosome small subunit-dependent GTPase A [Rhodocyclaceae bacterium]
MSDPGRGPEGVATRGVIVLACGRHYEVETGGGRRLHAFPRTRRESFVCGDRVAIEEQDAHHAIIVSAEPRASLLHRSDAMRERRIAANVDQVVVIAATEPAFSDELITRALVAAEHQALGALLVLNKIDLAARLAEARSRLAPFAAAGYAIVEISALRDAAALRPWLAGRLSVLVGGSGAGKSSLVNALLPHAGAQTGEISRALDSGRHTTSLARLYRLDASSAIIDSPGMQLFGLAHVPGEALAGCFPELRPYAGRCRFRDCGHDREPGCAVREAIDSGALGAVRHAHFLRLAAELSRSRRGMPQAFEAR